MFEASFLKITLPPFLTSIFPRAPYSAHHSLPTFSTSSLLPYFPSYSHPNNNLLLLRNRYLSHFLLPTLISFLDTCRHLLISCLTLLPSHSHFTLPLYRNVLRETQWCLCCQMVWRSKAGWKHPLRLSRKCSRLVT